MTTLLNLHYYKFIINMTNVPTNSVLRPIETSVIVLLRQSSTSLQMRAWSYDQTMLLVFLLRFKTMIKVCHGWVGHHRLSQLHRFTYQTYTEEFVFVLDIILSLTYRWQKIILAIHNIFNLCDTGFAKCLILDLLKKADGLNRYSNIIYM
jgi:hypothetical protein